MIAGTLAVLAALVFGGVACGTGSISNCGGGVGTVRAGTVSVRASVTAMSIRFSRFLVIAGQLQRRAAKIDQRAGSGLSAENGPVLIFNRLNRSDDGNWGDEAVASSMNVDNESITVLTVAQRATQCRNMDSKIGRRDK